MYTFLPCMYLVASKIKINSNHEGDCQCDSQIGAKFFELISDEHDIDLTSACNIDLLLDHIFVNHSEVVDGKKESFVLS